LKSACHSGFRPGSGRPDFKVDQLSGTNDANRGVFGIVQFPKSVHRVDRHLADDFPPFAPALAGRKRIAEDAN
jgi:hypothetical protein